MEKDMRIKPLPPRPAHHALAPVDTVMRRSAAAVLRSTGRTLQRLGDRLGAAAARLPAASQPARLEFHAEAGAPEGALYVDGQLVAHLAGVRRL
jgi:hypothetical protein